MRATVLTQLINSEAPWIKKKCQTFTFGSDGEVWCAGMCDWPTCAISVSCQFFGGCTCKVLTRITRSRTEKIHTKKCEVVQACTHISTRELHSDLLPDTHVYYQRPCWRKGLVLGQRSWQWDLMAKTEIGSLVRERGLAEVQKQRQSQMETLDKHRGITRNNISEKWEIVCSVCPQRKIPKCNKPRTEAKQKRAAWGEKLKC